MGVEGLEPIVAAGVIGVKPEALRKRLSRARTMLAAALQPSGRSSGELVTGGEKP